MFTRRQLLLLLSAAICPIHLAGCGADGGAPDAAEPVGAIGGVAVIDLDAVAHAIGWDTHMAADIQQRADSLNQQLANYQALLRRQLDDEKSAAASQATTGDEGPSEQQQKLVEFDRRLGAQWTQARQKANQQLAAHRLAVIESIRQHVRPVAASVAAELGLATVLTKNDSVVFTYVEAVDITDRVVQRLQPRAANETDVPPVSTANRPAGHITR